MKVFINKYVERVMKNIVSQQLDEAILLRPDQSAAFVSLVKAYQSRLYHFIMRHVSNQEDAAELSQQAFIEAYRSFANFRGDSTLSTWLYGIARNLIRNYVTRSPYHLYHFESEEMLANMAGGLMDPDSQASMAETLSAVQVQLDALSEEMRTALEMVTIDEMSYEETAEELHVPVGTVRSRVFRARAQLKTALISAGFDGF